MIWAVISDIHGNYPALRAVLADAQANGAGHFLFLGDYTNSLPFQNEIAETLRALPHKTAIRGNHEGYLINFHESGPDTPVPALYRPLWWSYRRHTPENLRYLTSLPATAQTPDGLYLYHDMKLFFRAERIGPFHSSWYKQEMQAGTLTPADYPQRAAAALLARPDAMADVRALPLGVHLFGHNHLPFLMEAEGRLFVNPGSCGSPLDFDARAAYALLTGGDGGPWRVTQRRVDYDKAPVAEAMRRCGFAEECPEFHAIYLRQLYEGVDYIGAFLRHVRAAAAALGAESLQDDAVWQQAVRSWRAAFGQNLAYNLPNRE